MIDRSKYIDKFIEELEENFSVIERVLLVLSKGEAREEDWTDLKRALHTAKGSARLMGFSKMEELFHGLENIVVGYREGRFLWNNKLLRLFRLTLTSLRSRLKQIQKDASEGDYDISEFLDALYKANSGAPYRLPEREAAMDGNLEDGNKALEMEDLQDTLSNATIRVPSKILDDVIYAFGELFLKQAQLKRVSLKYRETRKELAVDWKVWQKEMDASRLSASYQSQFLRDMQKFEKLEKQFDEHHTILEWESKNFLDSLLALRLMPLDLILDPLEGFIIIESEKLGKQTKTILINPNLQVDKFIIEKINAPLVHIVRNAVDHGIEPPELRKAKGKAEEGSITIRAAIKGGRLLVSVADDGAGIDLEAIRKKILEQFPEKKEELEEMKQGELVSYIFRPGFSTKGQVDSLSGRGMGMDIARKHVELLKGKIDVRSKKDEGTTITMDIPLSLSMIEGFFVRAKTEQVFLPNNFVAEVITLPRDKILTVLNKEAFSYRGETVGLIDINILLQRPARVKRKKNLQIVVLEWLEQYLGLLVEDISEFASLVHKPLPEFTSYVDELMGFVYDENFNIVPIIYTPALIERFYKLKDIDLKPRYDKSEKKYKHILLVDDSPASRGVQKETLRRYGFHVEETDNGIDALELLEKINFNLIITESSMPKMDGLTFVENLRRTKKFKNLPVLLFTTNKEKSRFQKFQGLGVQRVILKENFNRSAFLETVENLLL